MLGPIASGVAAARLLVGFSLPGHASAGRGRAGHGGAVRAGARTRDHRAVDNLGGILSVVMVGALVLAINFAAVPGPGLRPWGCSSSRLRASLRSFRPPAPGGATRSTTSTSPPSDLLGGRLRRNHRVRLPDGLDLRRAAVPAERAGLLDVRRRPAILPAAFVHGDRRSSLGEARRGQRRSVHAAPGLRRSAPGLPDHAPALGRGRRTGRSAWPMPSSASASGSPARPRPTRSPARSPCTRAGMASGTADLQRDLGGAIMQSSSGRCSRRDTPRPSPFRAAAAPAS